MHLVLFSSQLPGLDFNQKNIKNKAREGRIFGSRGGDISATIRSQSSEEVGVEKTIRNPESWQTSRFVPCRLGKEESDCFL
jgi:hypothetical protein